MNYRHAFHAGNFADCAKHALLVPLLQALRRKDTPFAVLDTHAGLGAYDLQADQAQRTGEAEQGILKLLAEAPPPAALAEWLALVRQAGAPARYPGSATLIRMLLRPQDRLAAVELHPEDHAGLRQLFRRDAQVAVHHRDAWEAIKGLTPFPEKRGLILIDPPFEEAGEFERITQAMLLLRHRFRAGIVAAWYPIKHRAPVRAFHHSLLDAGLTDLVTAELWLREPVDPQRLNGTGLVVMNPPWHFDEAANAILASLHATLGTGETGVGEVGAGYAVQSLDAQDGV